ncbi:hypothetical protein BN7_47 [Wickerhamomyces ciferrii]|uniref:Large ribosomal subunit protein mL60 n=1 Tax=Wickerhamomyces ciferrii (strain ATCC 14091 / BCRC 22168 / CBS 111 / JCM 3599 / NBRC 0793 / NRRL Y-1031 F-60-10) TaxID=1206466 RepID=K0KGE8_WICCF|nr:uncharacterized protein BN7_47 [Wickerhamomyces ciferrii]CCH40514.1 hypothetical protein BN7_47 [Wickerhamomyces ciferrii]
MFGAFRQTTVAFGGLLWKTPYKMSQTQKFRHRKRLQAVDKVIETVFNGLKAIGESNPKVNNFYYNFPKESEMTPRDKYTVFSKKSKGYRKPVHKVPKWTKLSMRENPKYF